LHEFVRHQVAESEGCDVKYCQIVDAHYFRGRPHLPLGPDGEKGIDVWLALEAYELAIYKRYDVSVLVACDGDFLPLVRKLNTIGTRVMLLGWDFKYVDRNGQDRETRTAQVLLDEVSYPIMVHQVIDDRSRRNDRLVNALFVPHKGIKQEDTVAPPGLAPGGSGQAPDASEGKIRTLKGGYGFIAPASGGTWGRGALQNWQE
jgi:hypothetical protein